MIQDLLAEAEQKMSQAVDHVVSEFATVRTGRANPQILKRVTVDYYGTPTPVLQLASVNVPEPRLMVVSPYDPNSLSDIEKAISSSDLGLNPLLFARELAQGEIGLLISYLRTAAGHVDDLDLRVRIDRLLHRLTDWTQDAE